MDIQHCVRHLKANAGKAMPATVPIDSNSGVIHNPVTAVAGVALIVAYINSGIAHMDVYIVNSKAAFVVMEIHGGAVFDKDRIIACSVISRIKGVYVAAGAVHVHGRHCGMIQL